MTQLIDKEPRLRSIKRRLLEALAALQIEQRGGRTNGVSAMAETVDEVAEKLEQIIADIDKL